MLRSFSLRTWAAIAVLAIPGCGPSRPTVPDTPDGTVTSVAQELAAGKPEILWSALPASYQKQLQDDVVRAFATKMDAEVYGKSVTVLKKLVGVLRSKRDFILPQIVESPMFAMAQVEKEKVEQNWHKVVGLLDTILDSELGDLERLKAIDVGRFLRTTGGKVMQQVAELSAMSEEDPYKKEFQGKAAGVKAEVTKSEGDSATLKVVAPGGTEESMELVRVEGKWLPKDLVDGWDEAMKQAKAAIAEMDPDSIAQMKPQIMGTLTGVETALDQLAKASTPEEFQNALGGLLGTMPFPMGMSGMGPDDAEEGAMPPGFQDFDPDGLESESAESGEPEER